MRVIRVFLHCVIAVRKALFRRSKNDVEEPSPVSSDHMSQERDMGHPADRRVCLEGKLAQLRLKAQTLRAWLDSKYTDLRERTTNQR